MVVLLCVKTRTDRKCSRRFRPACFVRKRCIFRAASVPPATHRAPPGPKVHTSCGLMPIHVFRRVLLRNTGICRGATRRQLRHLEMARAISDAVGAQVLSMRSIWMPLPTLGERPGVCVHHFWIAGRGGSQSRPGREGTGHVSCRADDEGLSEGGAGRREPPSSVERP